MKVRNVFMASADEQPAEPQSQAAYPFDNQYDAQAEINRITNEINAIEELTELPPSADPYPEWRHRAITAKHKLASERSRLITWVNKTFPGAQPPLNKINREEYQRMLRKLEAQKTELKQLRHFQIEGVAPLHEIQSTLRGAVRIFDQLEQAGVEFTENEVRFINVLRSRAAGDWTRHD